MASKIVVYFVIYFVLIVILFGFFVGELVSAIYTVINVKQIIAVPIVLFILVGVTCSFMAIWSLICAIVIIREYYLLRLENSLDLDNDDSNMKEVVLDNTNIDDQSEK